MKKEELKKKCKSTLNKMKKSFKKLLTNIKELCIELWDKFMILPAKVRMVICVWLIVIVLVLGFIGISNGSKKFYAKYDQFEKNVSDRALQYIKEKNYFATKDNKIKVNLETLKEEGYVDITHISDETCEGITVVYYDDYKEDYVIDTYLNCKRYTSKNYWDYK